MITVLEEIHRFRLGDPVTWTSEDAYVPCGRAWSDMLIAEFGIWQYLFNAAELRTRLSES